MKNYIHREVTVSISTLVLDPEITVKCAVKVETDNVMASASVAASNAIKAFAIAIDPIRLPADPLKGDEAMLVAEIRYCEVPDEGCLMSFETSDTGLLKPGFASESIGSVIANALSHFTANVGFITDCKLS